MVIPIFRTTSAILSLTKVWYNSSYFLHPFMIDVGIWGIPKSGYPFDGIKINQNLEEELTNCEGKKMNYGKMYYTKETFKKLYNLKEYQKIRKKYNSHRLKHILDKIQL